MVIIEGPDASGKSTLISYLLGEFGDQLELAESSKGDRNAPEWREPVNVRKRTYTALSQAVIGTHRVQVHDRLFFSELVYGEVLRGGACFRWKEQQHILRVLTALSPPVVLCLPPVEAYLACLPHEKQMEGVIENSLAIYRKYEALCTVRHPRITVYDYTRGPAAPKRIRRLVKAYLERRSSRSWSPLSSTTST